MNQRWVKNSAIVILIVFFSCVFTLAVERLIWMNDGTLMVSKAGSETYKKIEQVEQYISTRYYQQVDKEKLLEGALKGMVEGLNDPYSVYYTKDEYAHIMEMFKGEFAGIGVVVSEDQKDGYLLIVHVYKDSPAEKAGIIDGDKITHVDDKDIRKFSFDQVIAAVRGDVGTEVKISVLRGDKKISMSMKRETIELERIAYHKITNDVGYIRIIEFTGNAEKAFKEAVTALKAEGVKGFVVDVRDNPGGGLEVVVGIADMIMPSGNIIQTQDRYRAKHVEASADEEALNMPMVILTNGNSASASELFAGTLQDYALATIVGTKTYGKGTMQTIDAPESFDGDGIRITIAEFFTGKGRAVKGIGITPDVVVELPQALIDNPQNITEQNDTQIQKALEVLKHKIAE